MSEESIPSSEIPATPLSNKQKYDDEIREQDFFTPMRDAELFPPSSPASIATTVSPVSSDFSPASSVGSSTSPFTPTYPRASLSASRGSSMSPTALIARFQDPSHVKLYSKAEDQDLPLPDAAAFEENSPSKLDFKLKLLTDSPSRKKNSPKKPTLVALHSPSAQAVDADITFPLSLESVAPSAPTPEKPTSYRQLFPEETTEAELLQLQNVLELELQLEVERTTDQLAEKYSSHLGIILYALEQAKPASKILADCTARATDESFKPTGISKDSYFNLANNLSDLRKIFNINLILENLDELDKVSKQLIERAKIDKRINARAMNFNNLQLNGKRLLPLLPPEVTPRSAKSIFPQVTRTLKKHILFVREAMYEAEAARNALTQLGALKVAHTASDQKSSASAILSPPGADVIEPLTKQERVAMKLLPKPERIVYAKKNYPLLTDLINIKQDYHHAWKYYLMSKHDSSRTNVMMAQGYLNNAEKLAQDIQKKVLYLKELDLVPTDLGQLTELEAQQMQSKLGAGEKTNERAEVLFRKEFNLTLEIYARDKRDLESLDAVGLQRKIADLRKVMGFEPKSSQLTSASGAAVSPLHRDSPIISRPVVAVPERGLAAGGADRVPKAEVKESGHRYR